MNWPPVRLSPAMSAVAVALAVAVPTAMDAWWNEPGTRQADWVTYAMVVVSIGALLVRRRWPVVVALVCGAAYTGWYLLGHHGELLNLPAMVALYTVAVTGERARSIAVAVVASVWSGSLGYLSDDPIGARGGAPMLELIWPLIPIAMGEAVRAQRQLRAEHQASALRDRADREREARDGIEAERRRMAREIHDVVAHTTAAVNVQIGVAIAAFDTHPDKAREALTEARASSREALRELRHAVDMLRGPGADEPMQPAPTLAFLDGVVDTVRAAGIAVEVRMDTLPPRISPAVELAAYRIVQEALTNVLRHARARHVEVSIESDDDDLVVAVLDDGTGWADGGPSRRAADGNGHHPGGGHGLVGMAERAASLGGSVEHGPGDAGGFGVRARLPLGVEHP